MPHDVSKEPRDERGRWTTKGKVAAAVSAGLLAMLTSAAGGADVTTSIGSGFDAASNASSQIESDAARSKQSAKKGNEAKAEAETWQKLGLKVVRERIEHDLRCPLQSYGQIQQFFIENPCDNLDQRLVVLTDFRGNYFVEEVSWVTMPSDDTAEQLLALEDTYGSGDVTPYATQVLELDDFRFTGRYYKSRVDGSLVVIAETEPLSGHPSTTLLHEAATGAVVLPPP